MTGARLLPAVILSLCLAACADSTAMTFATLAWNVAVKPPTSVTLEDASAVPYASIGVQVGSSNQFIMPLATDLDGKQEWMNQKLLVATRNGRIVQTAGMPFNLGRLEQVAHAPAPGTAIGAPVPNTRYSLYFDLVDLNLFAIEAACTATDRGLEQVDILGGEIPARHIVEDCDMHALDWSFENDFWTDPNTGFVWKSVQNVHPKLAAVTIMVLRPPSS